MNKIVKPVKKVLILAGGWGTRLLPFTKSVPKELLPVLNKPLIHYLIQEAEDAGIEEAIIVISSLKKTIIKYFDNHKALEKELHAKGKTELLECLRDIKTRKIKIRKSIQKKQLGLGHAIAINAKLIGDEPFAVILGDDLIDSKVPALKQLIEAYNQVQSSIIGVQSVADEVIHKYGIADPIDVKEKHIKMFKIKGAIEKPVKEKAPSNKALLGRYIFTPEILPILKQLIKTWDSKNQGEINVIDAFRELLVSQSIYALEFTGNRYDLGSVDGFIKANIDLAMQDDELRESIKKHLHKNNLC